MRAVWKPGELIALIQPLHAQGLSNKAIAERLDARYDTVRRALWRARLLRPVTQKKRAQEPAPTWQHVPEAELPRLYAARDYSADDLTPYLKPLPLVVYSAKHHPMSLTGNSAARCAA